ncbi:MAG: 50S ribosomal protein L6 [Candidatus Melainabacteria bacterium RIFOXYA12_FULL_32_12]|nr:MAG: 50S ribosomal protein L6 [Candidatus Melainabacteria bacterium GWF2_32_7]OGI22668.1 MAG: 50S ribosomal protein L6 [Candidatus Melainabacteria bacterium RIFOXYA2_FULL_32_9]OGI31773.1 MAG: 50S ribosomal protein L6 [Candidatus Melainabacteria bacterium RIFOXYA12_FULL_32_12]
MSRIGKAPVVVPDKVEVKIENNVVTAKGPLGTLNVAIRSEITVKQEDGKIILERTNDERKTRALHGLSRTLVYNLVNGVNTGFSKNLEIHGVGYKATKEGNTLILALGYSHPVKIDPPEGLDIKVEGTNKITVSGADKQAVGDLTALIRSKRPPEVYKGKGIRYQGEYIRKKAGKTGK